MVNVVACNDCSATYIKIIKNYFERGENLLQNGIRHFTFSLS